MTFCLMWPINGVDIFVSSEYLNLSFKYLFKKNLW